MRNHRQIYLRLSSNVSSYKVSFYGKRGRLCFNVTRNPLELCINTTSRYLQVEAVPKTDGYDENLCFTLDTLSCNCYELTLNFNPMQPPTALKTFTLSDRNYGLKIDGILSFRTVV